MEKKLNFRNRIETYQVKFPLKNLFYFIFYKILDLLDNLKRKKAGTKILRLYGLYGYYGLWGQGKTISMTKELLDLRQKYGSAIYIATNYNFELQDFPLESWEQLTQPYNRPLVVGWDEIQNEFSSREFKKFPIGLQTLLTQNRKGNGVRILYSAQRWDRVDKVFRELTHVCFECKTRFGRLTSVTGYHWEEYQELVSTPAVKFKMKIKPVSKKIFVQTNYLRGLFDTYKILNSAVLKFSEKS